ncbi:hypothetical protein AVEN_240738-1, partial [Araneus ventricosus]
MKVFRLLSGTT